ncbi:MAG: hypothetical protein K1X53_08895 [Candidatus Sumerlaeaceae bacterium]|nr:hypothetical protein [Candidatus Sumerlaeaceae bacterium]
MDLALQLAETEDVAALNQLANLLAAEGDPAKLAIYLEAMAHSPALASASPDLVGNLAFLMKNTDKDELRLAAANVLGMIPRIESAEALASAFEDSNSLPDEKINAAENLLHLAALSPGLVSDSRAQAVVTQLQYEAQAADDPNLRSQALMALGERREMNTAFYRQMQESETDPNVRRLLDKLLGVQTAGAADPATQLPL